ncbi:tubulin-tyrosine ligase [Microbotryum lychnidis-dioicae p1A1 Lamole]|uniref:Tubulin-tyrosine ligase n=1 Tax=Microbotryum lychnidis-dioicae (strain p1A1 Lamole / MvSl-1064) TaxID=683840 RepID=U5H8S1_USTV1|nr:tubulin-tyrosine ligase [Microbotryum lychnidis-dioicae p1A1 Lamole]|eukprot:KDE06070.1 tubulin-tyrosine ligase [Microbotryum lychnidis-dioicae p1A1 Lamole]
MTTQSTPTPRRRVALVQYPRSQDDVVKALRRAFEAHPEWSMQTTTTSDDQIDLQWSDYDQIDWDLVEGAQGKTRLVNSYVIRKGLIRKNHLSHTIALYLSKNPTSPLARAAPQTFYFTLSFADELDELLVDELYDVQHSFDTADPDKPSWWVLKAALADKGVGIRLFSDRAQLEQIFQEFEPVSNDDEEEEEDYDEAFGTKAYGTGTRVDSSQLREWVVQRYVSNPLLFSPSNNPSSPSYKFHLRVYVVASGALTVHVHHPFLALFAPTPYSTPESSDKVDLSAHLTNTCLQTTIMGSQALPDSVNTLQKMQGYTILGGALEGQKLTREQITKIEDSVGEVVAELFKAAVGAGTSFQALPNAFEIFGLDFLVDDELRVSLLEVNACPDFGQTGPKLQSVIDHLFASTLDELVIPYFKRQEHDLPTSVEPRDAYASAEPQTPSKALQGLILEETTQPGLRKVLAMEISKAWS